MAEYFYSIDGQRDGRWVVRAGLPSSTILAVESSLSAAEKYLFDYWLQNPLPRDGKLHRVYLYCETPAKLPHLLPELARLTRQDYRWENSPYRWACRAAQLQHSEHFNGQSVFILDGEKWQSGWRWSLRSLERQKTEWQNFRFYTRQAAQAWLKTFLAEARPGVVVTNKKSLLEQTQASTCLKLGEAREWAYKNVIEHNRHERNRPQKPDIVFTDATVNEKQSGFAFYINKELWQCKGNTWPTQFETSSTLVELAAVAAYLGKYQKMRELRIICADSQAALIAIQHLLTGSLTEGETLMLAQLKQAGIDLPALLANINGLELRWVRGHGGNPRNEMANWLARQAAFLQLGPGQLDEGWKSHALERATVVDATPLRLGELVWKNHSGQPWEQTQ